MTLVAPMTSELMGDDFEGSFRALTPDERRETVSGLFGTLTENLRQIALSIKVMEELGEPVPEMITAELRKLLRSVAGGTLLPEVVRKFFGTSIIRRIADLPVSEQKKFANDDPIEVAEFADDGKITKRLLPPSELKNYPSLVSQVFGKDGTLRTVEEQARHLSIEPKCRSIESSGKTIRLPVRLYKKIEREAAESGVSIPDLIAARFR